MAISMLTVGIKTLKNKLSEYVRLALAGQTILISDRDRVVAELATPSATRAREVPGAILADAVRSGFITPAVGSIGPAPSAPATKRLGEVLTDLKGDRDDR